MSLPWPKWTRQQWIDAPLDGSAYDIALKYDPAQPRDREGQWTDTGASEEARLKAEAEVGIKALEALLPKAIETATYTRRSTDDEDGEETDEASGKWEDLDSYTQSAAEQSWINGQLENGIDVDTSSLDEEFKKDLERDNEEIVEETLKDVVDNLEQEFPVAGPYLPIDDPTTEQVEVFERYRVVDPETIIPNEDEDARELQDLDGLKFKDGTPLTPEEQNKVRALWEDRYRETFDAELQKQFESDSYYEQRNELEMEEVQEQWNNLDDEEKFNEAEQMSKSLSYRTRTLPPPLPEKKAPDTWIPGLDSEEGGNSEDAIRTRAIALQLVALRTEELIKERGYASLTTANAKDLGSRIWEEWKGSSSNDYSLAFQIAAAQELGGVHRIPESEVERLIGDHEEQSVGKASDGLYDSTEIGQMRAYARAQWETTQFVLQKAGVERAQVYRGLMMPGDEVDSTPKVVVDKFGTVIPEAATDYTPPQTYVALPELPLKKAGLQSSTVTRSIANNWNGVGNLPPNPTRVVLRVDAPRTSMMSIPIFGQNVHGEREVVLVGTKERWSWDAWERSAPEADQIPIGKQISSVSTLSNVIPETPKAPEAPKYTSITQIPNPEKASIASIMSNLNIPIPSYKRDKKLVIDLQKEDAGKPHWLSNIVKDRYRATQKARREKAKKYAAILKYDPSQPRDAEGKWSSHGVTVHAAGSSVQLPGRYDTTKIPKGSLAVTTKNGYILVTQHPDAPEYMWVNHVRVDDASQGKGEGTALYLGALRAAQKKGFLGIMRGDTVGRGVSSAASRVWASFERRGWTEHITLHKEAGPQDRVVLVRGPSLKYDPAQPRDKNGQWTAIGGGRGTQAQIDHAGTGSSGGTGLPAKPQPNVEVQSVANAYNRTHGQPPIDHATYLTVDEQRAGSIADAYDAMPVDDSANPEVQEAYEALGREVDEQYAFATARGMQFIPWTKEGQPYATSVEMANDVRENKRLYFYTGGDPHPFLGVKTDSSGLTLNDKFRAIHDYFGHAAGGYGFGARGEENAWNTHVQMFSAPAARAMTTETRGQNSWVNFGRQNYDAQGNYRNIPAATRPFAVQKVALLPKQYWARGVQTFARTLKFNPYHDVKGRFTFAHMDAAGGGGSTGLASPEQFKALKAQWAHVNNELLGMIETPNSPEAKAKMEELKGICKMMHRLEIDHGGHEGIGMPGGARDMVVIGAGPGGLSAAVIGGTDGLDTLVIDAQAQAGGQAKFSSRIENYPGYPIGTSGETLAHELQDQAERVGAEIQLGVRVSSITHDAGSGLKTVTLSDGTTVQSRTVVIASGVGMAAMSFPGSDKVVYGDSKTLADQAAGGSAVVIGGSNGAAQAALGVARKAKVTVVSRSPITKSMSDYQVQALRNHPNITIVEGDEITAFDPSTGRVTTKGGLNVQANAVGAFIGGGPNTSWLPEGIQRDKSGRVVVNQGLETTMPGVFAVGDSRVGSIGRIGAAVGDGQLAAKGVWDYFDRTRPGKDAR